MVSLAVCFLDETIMTLVLGRRRAGHGHLPIWIFGMYCSLLCLQLKISIVSGDLGCMDRLFHLCFPSLSRAWPRAGIKNFTPRPARPPGSGHGHPPGSRLCQQLGQNSEASVPSLLQQLSLTTALPMHAKQQQQCTAACAFQHHRSIEVWQE